MVGAMEAAARDVARSSAVNLDLEEAVRDAITRRVLPIAAAAMFTAEQIGAAVAVEAAGAMGVDSPWPLPLVVLTAIPGGTTRASR